MPAEEKYTVPVLSGCGRNSKEETQVIRKKKKIITIVVITIVYDHVPESYRSGSRYSTQRKLFPSLIAV